MTANLQLRPATGADFAHLAGGIAVLPVFAPYGFTAATLQERWDAALCQGEPLHVAVLDGRPVGLCWFALRGTFGGGAYLRFIAVLASAQGRGIGTALLQAFEQACQQAPGGLFVLTSQHNTDGLAFYQHHGYVQVGLLEGFAKAGINECIFWKKRPLQPT